MLPSEQQLRKEYGVKYTFPLAVKLYRTGVPTSYELANAKEKQKEKLEIDLLKAMNKSDEITEEPQEIKPPPIPLQQQNLEQTAAPCGPFPRRIDA